MKLTPKRTSNLIPNHFILFYVSLKFKSLMEFIFPLRSLEFKSSKKKKKQKAKSK